MRENVLAELARERDRQDLKWGVQNHEDGTGSLWWKSEARHAKYVTDEAERLGTQNWRHILYEEVAESFAESDEKLLREELVQVAAVAIAWIEAIDRR